VQSGAIPQGYHAVANYRWVTGMRNVYAIQRQQNMDLASRIAEVIHNQFGLKLKEQSSMYRHPYPAYFDRVPLPNRYKMPDFSKFSGQDNVSTIEHISQFLAQCGEAAA